MGFMDKLKAVGGKALGGVALAAARSYGTVTKGKHNLCKVTLDNPMEKLVFIKIADIEAQYVIKDDIKTFCVLRESDAKETYDIELEFNDGETSTITITTNQNQGSALPTPEERIAARYEDMGKLVFALASKVAITDDTKNWANKIMRFARRKEL